MVGRVRCEVRLKGWRKPEGRRVKRAEMSDWGGGGVEVRGSEAGGTGVTLGEMKYGVEEVRCEERR